MFFRRVEPKPDLTQFIECYWIIGDEDTIPKKEKIIPDGFAEMIFHFGDPYRVKLNKEWELQSKSLLAGQIRHYFYLENTGASSIIGVKLRPTAITHLYQIPMHELTGKVADIPILLNDQLKDIERDIRSVADYDQQIDLLNEYFRKHPAYDNYKPTAADHAVNKIIESKGMINLNEIHDSVNLGERQLENLFKKYVGLSPKFFTRIIRFNYIFQLVQKKNQNWSGLAYEAAYYDQSHFIRNFKSFTGENPSAYAFDEKNLANFFLNKK